MSEGPGVIFDTQTPADAERIGAQVRRALARGLPDADDGPIETLTVIANGPSALDWPGWSGGAKGPVIALNGALRLFVAHGMAPDFWAACDPQEIVARFLEVAPAATRYLVASKCHPAVFEALHDRDVRLWHVDEDGTPAGLRTIKPSSSITGTALALMRSLGWRKFQVWGWDGCFLNGLDHAAPQPIAPIDLKVAVLGDKAFHTTPTWAHEADGAWKRLAIADYEVEVMGPGLIAEMLRYQGVTPLQPARAA